MNARWIRLAFIDFYTEVIKVSLGSVSIRLLSALVQPDSFDVSLMYLCIKSLNFVS